MATPETLHITEVPFAKRSLRETLDDFALRKMTPSTKAQLRWAVAQHFHPEKAPRVLFVARLHLALVGDITEETFRAIAGRKPQDDDMHRANCPEEGKAGHRLCGWCETHETFRMTCGCLAADPPRGV